LPLGTCFNVTAQASGWLVGRAVTAGIAARASPRRSDGGRERERPRSQIFAMQARVSCTISKTINRKR
jgi:hypothetical protein